MCGNAIAFYSSAEGLLAQSGDVVTKPLEDIDEEVCLYILVVVCIHAS